MKAKFTTKNGNGRNLSNNKGMVSAKSLVVATRKGPEEIIAVRWWMGRSNSASVVYCTIWVHARFYTSGHGTAGGYGYHKASAALDDAIRSAGIRLSSSISGVGDSAVDSALQAIARALGYKGQSLIISH